MSSKKEVNTTLTPISHFLRIQISRTLYHVQEIVTTLTTFAKTFNSILSTRKSYPMMNEGGSEVESNLIFYLVTKMINNLPHKYNQ